MTVETRLRLILDEAKIPTRGRIAAIASGTGIARDTVRKFLYNQAGVFSLQTIGAICTWLQEQGLGKGLPGKLFAIKPPKMVEAILEPGNVSMVVGVYQGRPGFPRGSIARDDFAVAARLVAQLSTVSERAVGFTYVHVPSHMPSDGHEVDRSVLERDQRNAKQTYDRVRLDTKSGSAVLIGSQRANYAVECFVADLVNTAAFSSEKSPVPFYLKYQEPERSSSCFGGNTAPVSAGKSAPDGIYFRHRNSSDWKHFPSRPRQRGTGMVIVRRNPGLGRVELAIFGLSAFATAAMGQIFCRMPDRFQPLTRMRRGDEVGVYVCGFRIAGMKTAEQNIDSVTIGPPEIVRLDV
ncbi:MAG: helix-turn-helix transcriptional regulator [Phycisphaerales bacterium]